MPATLLIDREGKIADLQVGMVDKAAFEREIQILLNERTNLHRRFERRTKPRRYNASAARRQMCLGLWMNGGRLL
jgi:hypothetical protein